MRGERCGEGVEVVALVAAEAARGDHFLDVRVGRRDMSSHCPLETQSQGAQWTRAPALACAAAGGRTYACAPRGRYLVFATLRGRVPTAEVVDALAALQERAERSDLIM